MSELKNSFSNGTQGLNIPYDKEKSLVFLPSNEDYSMVVEVTSVLDGLVTATKVWDESANKKIFYAKLEYAGKSGIPSDDMLEIGQHVVFYRVGDFNSQGAEDYERHIENADNCSWVCLINETNLIYVRDLGNDQGEEVAFNNAGIVFIPVNSETLEIISADPVTFFWESTPPFKIGRIYAGQKILGTPNYYIVFLPAKGDTIKTFVQDAGGNTFTVNVDGQGNITGFNVE